MPAWVPSASDRTVDKRVSEVLNATPPVPIPVQALQGEDDYSLGSPRLWGQFPPNPLPLPQYRQPVTLAFGLSWVEFEW